MAIPGKLQGLEMLHFCDNCKEKSAVIKVYRRNDGATGRVEFCLNRSCGYKQPLPNYKEEVKE